MISPLASLMKPESIGCWISACTSVVSPLEVARTRMVDAICILPSSYHAHNVVGKPMSGFPDHARCPLAAATADGDFDFLVGAVKLAAGFHDHDDVAGSRHLDAVGDAWKRAGRNLV